MTTSPYKTTIGKILIEVSGSEHSQRKTHDPPFHIKVMDFPIPSEKIEHRHYINGEFSESSDKGTFVVKSPYSHAKIVDMCEASVNDTNRAVAAAKAAFPAWSTTDPTVRGSYLKKLAALIKDASTELAQLDAMSMGRPVSSYFDAMYTAGTFEHYAEAGYDAKGTTSLNKPGFVNMTLRQPIGPVAAIIPWSACWNEKVTVFRGR